MANVLPFHRRIHLDFFGFQKSPSGCTSQCPLNPMTRGSNLESWCNVHLPERNPVGHSPKPYGSTPFGPRRCLVLIWETWSPVVSRFPVWDSSGLSPSPHYKNIQEHWEINQSINQSSKQAIDRSINEPINQSINRFIHRSINPSNEKWLNESVTET